MAEIEAVAKNLAELDEESLTVQLGALSQYVEANPDAESIIALETMPTPKAAFDDLLQIGMNVLNSVSPQAYHLLCSPVEGVLIKDPDLARELTQLMDQKTSEAAAKATAIIAPLLTGSLGLPQSLAVVLGALLVKKLAQGTANFICTNWERVLESEANTPTNVSPQSP